MSEIIKKSFDVCEYEKLEKWLNEMADSGLTVVSAKVESSPITLGLYGKYEFEQSKKGEFKIAMLLLDKKHTAPESKKQIEFIEETGAHFVGMFDKWAIFRKQSKYGEFKLLSDNPSQIKNITNIMKRLTIKFVLYLLFNYFVFYNSVIKYAIRDMRAWNVSFFTALGPVQTPLLIVALVLLIYLFVLYTVTTIKLFKKRKELKRQATLFE